jgi:hypothetical protein
MSRHGRAMAVAACALALGVCGTASAGSAPTAQTRKPPPDAAAHGAVGTERPALWRVYDMLVNFQSLPRTYTCDQLWYEFHGILLRLGAPLASISILPYNCSPSPSGDMKSPNVEVRFQLPFLLPAGMKGAPIEAAERSIRLSPGQPKTLHASDCQLFQQIDQTLLASLPIKVHDAHFDCSGPPPRSGEFAVTMTLPVAATVQRR